MWNVNHAEGDWMKRILTFEVKCKSLRGRPRKTWMEVIKNDLGLRSLHANRVDAQNRTLWRKIVRGGGQAKVGNF